MSEKKVENLENDVVEGKVTKSSQNSVSVEEIGKKLRELRLEKNLSIEDVQEITKIRGRYIQAIEEGKIDKLPGHFYARAFLKSYAEVVGLDQDILDQYQESLPTPEIENVEIKPRYNTVSNSKLGKWLFVSLIYLMIGLVLLFAYMFYVNHSSPNDENISGDKMDGLEVPYAPDNQNGQESTNHKPPNEQTPVETPKNQVEITKIKTSTFNNRALDVYEVKSVDNSPIKVQLKFSDRCWFDIREDGNNGNQLLMGTYTAGQSTGEYVLGKQMWLHLGRASATEIYLNGKKIKAGSAKDPKYIQIIKK